MSTPPSPHAHERPAPPPAAPLFSFDCKSHQTTALLAKNLECFLTPPRTFLYSAGHKGLCRLEGNEGRGGGETHPLGFVPPTWSQPLHGLHVLGASSHYTGVQCEISSSDLI